MLLGNKAVKKELPTPLPKLVSLILVVRLGEGVEVEEYINKAPQPNK